MLRDKTTTFNSNANSTPIAIFQNNSLREAYFNFTATFDRAHHEWKSGVDSDNTFLRESLNYLITNPAQFDPGTAATFAFAGSRPDLEQSAFLQDTVHLHHSTIAAGLRWDHYQLLLNRHALEPRLAFSHYIPAAQLVLHASYDRVFQTPATDNILLSSSPQVDSIYSAKFLRLPVNPSAGDYYEIGVSKDISHQLRIDANYFRRFLSNFADDNQLQNTTIVFPIAFRKAIIYGFESQARNPRLAWLQRIRQLLLRSWQRLVSRHWRPLPRLRRLLCRIHTLRSLPQLAGPTQHRSRAHALPTPSPPLDRRRS